MIEQKRNSLRFRIYNKRKIGKQNLTWKINSYPMAVFALVSCEKTGHGPNWTMVSQSTALVLNSAPTYVPDSIPFNRRKTGMWKMIMHNWLSVHSLPKWTPALHWQGRCRPRIAIKLQANLAIYYKTRSMGGTIIRFIGFPDKDTGEADGTIPSPQHRLLADLSNLGAPERS